MSEPKGHHRLLCDDHDRALDMVREIQDNAYDLGVSVYRDRLKFAVDALEKILVEGIDDSHDQDWLEGVIAKVKPQAKFMVVEGATMAQVWSDDK